MQPENKLDPLYRLGQELILLRDQQQIADAVLQIAEEVLDFHDSEFLLVDEDTQELVAVAGRGKFEQQHSAWRLPLDGQEGVTVVAARSGQPVYVPDVREDPRYMYVDFRGLSELAVPLKIEDRVLGVINIESQELDAFTHADAQLLSTLASQAALALENARLYGRERRRAEELATINRVSHRIGTTLDLRETLDTIAGAAAELVPSCLVEISLWDEERQTLTLHALRCDPERAVPIGEVFAPGEGYTGWVVRHRELLLVPDVDARQDIRPHLLPGELPFKAYVGLPLLDGDELIGTLVLVHDRAGAFDEEDAQLLEALGSHAVGAIRNAQLYEELARRHREMAALNAVAAAINQAVDLQALLADAVEQAMEVVGADAGGIRLLSPEDDTLTFAYSQGLSPEYAAIIRTRRLGQGIAGTVALTGEAALIRDMNPSRGPLTRVRGALLEEGLRSRCEVALRSRDRIVGTLGMASRTPAAFGPADVDLLSAIGQQLGVAIENARLRQQAAEAERLAAVGRVAGTVAHDLRSPLGGIIRSAEFLARPEISAATRRKLSQSIVALARRLINTAQEILDFTRGGRTALRPVACSLPDFLDQIIGVLRVDCSDLGIEVVSDWQYTGEVTMDPDRMAQVVYNIAANAKDAMPEGGTLTIGTAQVGAWAELRFTDTGSGVPLDLVGRIFEPFVSYGKQEGAGLGLAIARRIVREHGGEIQVESPAQGGASFVVRLPLEAHAARSDTP